MHGLMVIIWLATTAASTALPLLQPWATSPRLLRMLQLVAEGKARHFPWQCIQVTLIRGISVATALALPSPLRSSVLTGPHCPRREGSDPH